MCVCVCVSSSASLPLLYMIDKVRGDLLRSVFLDSLPSSFWRPSVLLFPPPAAPESVFIFCWFVGLLMHFILKGQLGRDMQGRERWG